MKLFDVLKLLNPAITPEESKIHLAKHNGRHDPLDLYFADEFDEWQCRQKTRNFERNYVISFIKLPTLDNWLFAGVHNSSSPTWLEDEKYYYYDLVENTNFSELNGKLILSFSRTGRQSYLKAENWHEHILLSEIKPEKTSISEFSGYKNVNITKSALNLIVAQSLESWRTALSNVAGIYLISDTKSGKLYVGSATGEGGIWQRWSSYVNDGHGGNVKLRDLLREEAIERAEFFRYSILEIADTHTINEDILRRESHWKNVLLSRSHGLNGN